MRSFCLTWFTLSLVVACAPTADSPDTGATDGSTSSGEGEADSEADSGSGSGSESDSGEGQPCGEFVCGDDEYCDFDGDECDAGVLDETQCRPRPESCESPDNPDFTVCGCDGGVYESICEAKMAGVDLAADLCGAPEGMFACGWKMCELGTEICEWSSGEQSSWFCKSVPDVCENDYTCDCVKQYYDEQLICGYTNCADLEDGGVKLLCGQP